MMVMVVPCAVPAQWSVLTGWDLGREKQPVPTEKRFGFAAGVVCTLCNEFQVRSAVVVEPGSFRVVPALRERGVKVVAGSEGMELDDLRRRGLDARDKEDLRHGGAEAVFLLEDFSPAEWGRVLGGWLAGQGHRTLVALVEHQHGKEEAAAEWVRESLGHGAWTRSWRLRCR
eukprot:Hpha_TRINITY_DN7281_c0_g1::TRINITY_DN7281_c0_g1_i1::g.102270::m.102270